MSAASWTKGPLFALALLAIAYLVPGLVGHEPWKPDEPYTFGAVLRAERFELFVRARAQ